jgi:cytosine/adenosine deaminase-related metal-dependent hydrolase
VDCQIQAAKDLGVRFHASRGSMSLGQSQGGLPPDDCVEDEAFILRDSERVIKTYHDASTGSMTQIALAPCSPFSVTVSLLRDSAALARQYKVKLHTHLCETRDEERYTLERFQLRPVDWMESHGWLGDDVWFAHAIHVDDDEIKKFAQTGCGAAHCPCSNMRLGSDIGSLEPGKCADFFSLDLHTIGYAGALHDPVAATLFCAPQTAKFTVINGEVIVRDGEVVTVDMKPVIETHNCCAFEMAKELRI